MSNSAPTSQQVTDAIRSVAAQLGHPPSRSEFRGQTGITERQILNHFPSWRDAVRAAGLAPHTANQRADDDSLLEDWGSLVRKHRQIPTREQYRREGSFSPGVFEKHFGPWSALPSKFREFAKDVSKWADVIALLPEFPIARRMAAQGGPTDTTNATPATLSTGVARHNKLDDRPSYGNPIDFRGLRHEPINEQGVVFLFGMIAKELGYLVEAVQTGFPDCEAKRQIGPNNWQRVRIEFEFESRNFRDHGHFSDGCDLIVCWRHNWPESPPNLEVVELSTVIKTLSKSQD
jgi:hypothetical protein